MLFRSDKRAFVECTAEGNRLAVAPRAQRAAPRVDGLWRVCEDKAGSFRGASSLSAHVMVGIGPVEADEGSTCLVRELVHE